MQISHCHYRKTIFFNISESMHDNEIKNCVYIYIFMIRDWLRQLNSLISYKTYIFFILLANTNTTKKLICFKTFTGLHDDITKIVYIDIY